MNLEGKIVLITGAARGLGKEISAELSQAGASVVATDMRADELQKTVADINSAGASGNVVGKELDVRDEKQAAAVIEEIINEFGKIDVLINNAGVNVTASTETLDIDEWDTIINTNLRGNYLLSHLVFPYMKKSGAGHIICIASSLAKRVKENSPAYVASKWGILGLSQLLFIDGRKYGIKVTAFSPAGMNTRLLLDRFPDLDQSKLLDPSDAAKTIRSVLELPDDVSVPDIFVMSNKEETWP